MSKYFPVHVHDHHSLLDGLSKPWQIASRLVQLGLSGSAITNHGNVSSVVEFTEALKDACGICGCPKNRHSDGGKGKCNLEDCPGCPAYEPAKLKPILGCEFYLCKDHPSVKDKTNMGLSHLCVLAKNEQGWKNLIRATSESNRPDYFYKKPRLNIEELGKFAKGELVAFSGHLGSDLADVCFLEPKMAYRATTYEDAKLLAKDWPQLKKDALALAGRYIDAFGKENFFLEKQLIDKDNLPSCLIVGKVLDWLSTQLGLKKVATSDSHYVSKQDAIDQRVILCSALQTTLKQVYARIQAEEDVLLGGFFKSNNYHIPSIEEMVALHTQDELDNSVRISEMCTPYNIFSAPKIPKFDCPDGMGQEDYMMKLLGEGWKRKIEVKVPKDKHVEYQQRLDREFGVIKEAGLCGYFLIVQDYCTYAHKVLGCKKSKGRGSAAGCLISHLLDITDCDPIKYTLQFERFYNAGRNAPGKVSLPDIDCDFGPEFREPILEYVKNKFGPDKVCQMATFSRMQGRGALKEVLRVHDWGSFEQRNEITKYIPDEAAISDQLQEMREETGEASIIRWALEHNSDKLKEWCYIDDNGKLQGDLSVYFAQAIRLEGTKKSQSKHAAGVLISEQPLADICPMVYDKSHNAMISGIEYRGLEKMGLAKVDVLGVSALSKCRGAFNSARTGIIDVR